jgi:hypothetical protein
LKSNLSPLSETDSLKLVKGLSAFQFNWIPEMANADRLFSSRTENLADAGLIAQQVDSLWKSSNPDVINPVRALTGENNRYSLSAFDSLNEGDAEYMTVAYQKFIPILIAAAKQLSTQVKELSSKSTT